MTMRQAALMLMLFLCCKTDLVFIDAFGSNSVLLQSTPNLTSSTSMATYSTQGMGPNSTHSFTEYPLSGRTSFVINPTKTTVSHNGPTTITSRLFTTMSASPSKSITKRTNTSRSDEGTTTGARTALYFGIGGGVGTLALISVGILICGCFSKYKSQHRVDSSEHTSDMPLGDCPSWRHVNVKHPLSSRITERTEHSSSYN